MSELLADDGDEGDESELREEAFNEDISIWESLWKALLIAQVRAPLGYSLDR